MMNEAAKALHQRPAKWRLALAFALLYVTWGTTYLAISEGVKTLPPALFSGTRFCLAGLIVLVYEAIYGRSLRLNRSEFLWIFVTGILFFVCGSGLLAAGEKDVASGVASVLIASTPLWMVLLERVAPRGERLTVLGWFGLILGLGGVAVLLAPGLQDPAGLVRNAGSWLVLISALAWALGAFVLRRRKISASHLIAAAYQMILGGASLALVGLIIGEHRQLTAAAFTPEAVFSFVYLLIVGSLIGFIAYNWLLGHVSAAMVGTHAYVNPVVAIFVGWLVGGELITPSIVAGMVIILLGVALVRSGEIPPSSFDLRSSIFGRTSEAEDRKSKLEDRETLEKEPCREMMEFSGNSARRCD